jgi:hypothetical protein
MKITQTDLNGTVATIQSKIMSVVSQAREDLKKKGISVPQTNIDNLYVFVSGKGSNKDYTGKVSNASDGARTITDLIKWQKPKSASLYHIVQGVDGATLEIDLCALTYSDGSYSMVGQMVAHNKNNSILVWQKTY